MAIRLYWLVSEASGSRLLWVALLLALPLAACERKEAPPFAHQTAPAQAGPVELA